MPKKTPLQTAANSLSGRTTAARLTKIERGSTTKKATPKPKTKVKNLVKPQKKHVDARKAKIAAAQAADRKAIAARNKRKS